MQYNHRSRLPPPPPPFGRGGGGGYPRGHKQLYYAPPPFPPPPPERKYEVLMEAGRLAAEYLVAQGVLPPAALLRGAGSSGAWAAHPLPPPPPPLPPQQQQQEPPALYGRRRYEDEYSNNASARSRRANGFSSSNSSRDDYSSGNYNGEGKRKYGEYRRGYSDSGRDREKERRRRSLSNGQRYEDEDEDGAPGFRRERRGSRGSDDVRSSVTEAVREEAPLAAKAVVGLDMEDPRSKIVSSVGDVRKDANAALELLEESEGGELEDDSKVLNSEPEVIKQGIGTDVNNASTSIVMESEHKQLPDGKTQDEIPDEEAEGDERASDEASFDHNTSDGEVTNMRNDMRDGKKDLIDYCDFTRAPTRPRSLRAHRNAASVPGEAAVAETLDPVSSGQNSNMVIGESANESSLTSTELENGEDRICQENAESSGVFAEPIEPMLLQENGTSIVTENMTEEKVNTKLRVVQEYNGETNLSPVIAPHEDSLMQEASLPSLTDSHEDSSTQEDALTQETDLSPLTASHNNSLTKETELPPLTESHKEDSLAQETDLSRTISSHENNLKLQYKEGIQMCDIDTLPQDMDLIEFSDQRKIVHDKPCPNAEAEAVTKMEEGKLDQSSSLNVSDIDLVGGNEICSMQDNPLLTQLSAAGSSVEPHNKQQEDPGTIAGANASATDDLCQLPLENKDVQVMGAECDTAIKVGGFDSSKSKNEAVCSSMDNMMHPGIDTDVLPGIQDGYNLAFSDFLGVDIPCYPPMQSDLHGGIGANDSEGITVMDDPIYGSLTDIGFMDMWGQPTQDYDKFF